MKWLEENMKYSFAVQKYVFQMNFLLFGSQEYCMYCIFLLKCRSDEVCCGICLDKIRLNPDSKDKRFGILRKCFDLKIIEMFCHKLETTRLHVLAGMFIPTRRVDVLIREVSLLERCPY